MDRYKDRGICVGCQIMLKYTATTKGGDSDG